MDGPRAQVEQIALAASGREGCALSCRRKRVGTAGPWLLADGPAQLVSWASGQQLTSSRAFRLTHRPVGEQLLSAAWLSGSRGLQLCRGCSLGSEAAPPTTPGHLH